MNRSRITIRDVAAQAGVSHQTVSRVLNAHERVTPETRARVEAAIAALGYRPNASARSLAAGRTFALACIAPNLTDYTFASIIEGAQAAAREQGYFVLSTSAADEASFAPLVEELVSSQRVDGLLVINPYADGRHQHLPTHFPVVLVGARPRPEAPDSVALDDEAAARLALQHLLELGHRQIAMITGPANEDCTKDRITGYAATLCAAGLTPNPALVVEGDWSATSGVVAVQHWLAQQLPFTALFAQNDRMAIGAIRALREAGYQVPADISVVGVDDMPLTAYFDPPLTTIRQDMALSGREAVRLLIRRLENPALEPQHLRLPAQLIIRSSTALVKGGESGPKFAGPG